MESLFLTRNQAQGFWSGSTDSKTLDYQRTNPREYQIVRTDTKETAWIQDPATPNPQEHSVQDTSSKWQIKQKQKPNHQQTGLPPHSALPIRGKTNKQIKTQHKSHPIQSYTNHCTKLRRTETIGRKNSTFFKERIQLSLKPGKRRPQTQKLKKKKKRKKRLRNTAQMKEQTRSTEVQINEEEIGKSPEK